MALSGWYSSAQQDQQRGEKGKGRSGGSQIGPISPRYSILPYSDPERCFSIEPEDGTIRTAVLLDREARVWHNLTVLATELGEEAWALRRQHCSGREPSLSMGGEGW